jgi:outer membrane receptor for ferrienterochelin and colicin
MKLSEISGRACQGRLIPSSMIIGLFLSLPLTAQEQSTVSYPADYFSQWNPVTVADMIDRIPGIAIVLDDSGGGNQNNRGLGSTENILINGRRLSGKDNDATAQLSRISFEQVSHIEIIRGTSTELVGVRNEGQIVNVVTLSSNELSVTVSGDISRYQDGHSEPGGALIFNGSANEFDYRVSLERAPAYRVVDSIEESVNGIGDFSPNDLRQVRTVTDQVNDIFNSNLNWAFSDTRNFTLNLLWEETDPPNRVERTILDYDFQPPAVFIEREFSAAQRRNWELGADYNWRLADGSQLQLLTINNQQDFHNERNRFRVQSGQGDTETLSQDLLLRNDTVETERIYRAVYTRPIATAHDLEFGLERAQTILETELGLSRLPPGGTDLQSVPVPNANSRIEELRYEGFVVHHWQLNEAMKLESTVLYEVSEISQFGDVQRSRDFNFLRPKVDYRYDITSNLQLQLSIEKFVAQLSFADFAANTDPRDEDRDTVAGNPELRQQQSWRYSANLDYRFADNRGVINARAWYWDVSDAIGRIDVSDPDGPLESASGNIGDGEVMALQLNSSYRVTPNLLVSAAALMRASEVTDPFSGVERRLVPNDRGYYSVGLRHDLTALNLNYGIDYLGASQGNRPLYDINRIDHIDAREDLSVFIERNAIGSLGLVARLEVNNILDRGMCIDRFRFDDHLAAGQLSEVERRCDERGSQILLRLRGTF